MTDLGRAMQGMEAPMMEVGTTAKALTHLALSTSDQETGVEAILFFLGDHLRRLHDDLYKNYKAMLEVSKESKENGPKLVG